MPSAAGGRRLAHQAGTGMPIRRSIGHGRRAGSFGFLHHDGVDSPGPVIGEVFEALGYTFEFVLPYQRDGRVPESGENLRLVTRTGTTAVFEKSHVTHIVQGILYAPVAS